MAQTTTATRRSPRRATAAASPAIVAQALVDVATELAPAQKPVRRSRSKAAAVVLPEIAVAAALPTSPSVPTPAAVAAGCVAKPTLPKAPNPRDANATLQQYAPLVRRLAHQMIAKLPANVELDDLVQVGLIGLADALTRFDAEQGVQFETFATQRIRGAMLDELRGNDHVSRGIRKQQRGIETAVNRLEHVLGRTPADSEVADRLGLTLRDYQEQLARVRGTQLIYLADIAGDDGGHDYLDRHVPDAAFTPLGQLQDMRMREALVAAIGGLPEREQQMMSMYYEHDMNLKEIAAVLKVTESRVCQLHSQSIARLRHKLREH